MKNPFRSVLNRQQQQQQQQQPQQSNFDIEDQTQPAPRSLSFSQSGLDHRRQSQHAEVLKELTAAEKKATLSTVGNSGSGNNNSISSSGNNNNNSSINANMNRSMSPIDLDVSVRPGKGILIVNNNPKSPSVATPDPRLIHPVLLRVPLHIRFGINGVLSNIVFMLLYNWALVMFEDKFIAPNIYAAVYLVFIPISHFMVSILVFGWPEHYCNSLLNNFPIGLTAIALGTALTAYLDSIQFSKRVDEYVIANFTFLHLTPKEEKEEEKSEFWSSLVVLAVTSIWTYILSIVVNQVPAKSDKKEL